MRMNRGSFQKRVNLRQSSERAGRIHALIFKRALLGWEVSKNKNRYENTHTTFKGATGVAG